MGSKSLRARLGLRQIAYTLRTDPVWIVMERTNVRYVRFAGQSASACRDGSVFHSLKLLLPTIKNWLTGGRRIIPLIKPAVRGGQHDVGTRRRGARFDVIARVLDEVLTFAAAQGLAIPG